MVKLIKYLRLLVAFSVLISFCAANQVYKWKTIAFKDLTRDVDTIVDGENVYYNEENVILTGFDYDVETGYICAAFPRIKPSVPVTIGCFSADEYDKNETPKFTAFPTVADNDLPDWPAAKLPLGASRGFNYRQGRARRNLTAYYYSEMGEDESSEDDDWMHVGNMEMRQASAPPTKKKAFTGFSSLGNLFVKKDKKDVVVAVADENTNANGANYHRKKKQPQHYSSEEEQHQWRPYEQQDDSQVIVLQQHDKGAEGEKKKDNRFLQFFGNIGNKFTSVFKRNGGDKKHDEEEVKPVYQVNLQHTSSEEQIYHRPTTYVAPAYYSSEENNKWQSWPPKESSQKYHISAPLYFETEDGDRYRPYKHSSYKKKKVEYSSEEEYERPSRYPSNKKKTSYNGDIPLYNEEEEQEDGYRPIKNNNRNGPRISPPADKYDDVPLYNERSANFPKVRHEKRPQSFFYQERNINGEEITAQMEDEMKMEEVQEKQKKKVEKMPVDKEQEGDEDEDLVQQDDEKVQKKVKPIRINRPYNFISVHNVRFDKCGRLWFIDVGTVERASNSIFYRNPILWAFEVKVGQKGKLISRPYLRHEMEDTKPTGLRSLVVDVHEDCDDYHVYMPNSKDNRVVVYGSEVGGHWQFEHTSMAPVLKEVDTKVQDLSYKFTAGVYSLSLGMRDVEGFRDVYYTPASGTGQFKVSSHLLRDERAAPNKFNPKLFRFVGYRGKDGLTRSQVYDPRTEVLFSASVEQPAVKCWNTNKLLTPDYYGTAYTHKDMIFGFDLKLDRKGNLWSLANKYQMLLTNGLDVAEDNFSLYRMKPKEVIKGTVCDNNKRRDRALEEEVVDDSDKRFDAEKTKDVEEKKVEVKFAEEKKVEVKLEEEKKKLEVEVKLEEEKVVE